MRIRLLLGISVLWIPLAFLFDGVTLLALPVRLGGGATDLGLVSFVGLGVAAGIQPVLGWLSDRWRGRVDRRVFAAGAMVPAIAGLWLLLGTTGLVAAVLGYILVQASASGVQASQQTLIPEHVGDKARGRASGLKSAFDVGGAFVAFVVLGAVLSEGGLVAAGMVTTLVLIVAMIVMLSLVPARPRPPDPEQRSSGFPAGLASLIAARFLFLLATYAVGRFLLLLVAERLGIPFDRAADEAGGLLALFTLATAGAALPFGMLADRVARRQLMAFGAVAGAVGIAFLVPAAGIAGLVIGGLLMSVGTAAFVTANWAATTALVPAPDAGRLMGVANLGTALAAAAAGLFGPLIDLAGFGSALLVAAVLCAAAIVPLRATSLRRTRTAESPI